MPNRSESRSREPYGADVRERDAAVCSDAALVSYQQKWQRRLLRLQRSYPARWRVPGLSDEEVRDALTLRLIEVVRGDRALHQEYESGGGEWGLAVMRRHLSELRRSFRLSATPTDFSDEPARERDPDQEQQLMDLESEACRGLAAERAQSQLSRPQRRWLAALKLAANCGAFFEASQQLNLSAAARVLQKNRSSAQRAYRELQAQFSRELERLK
jgi:hypothetical protein